MLAQDVSLSDNLGPSHPTDFFATQDDALLSKFRAISDLGNGSILLTGPKQSGKTSLLFQYAFNQIIRNGDDAHVVFITPSREKLEKSKPCLPLHASDHGPSVLSRVHIRCVKLTTLFKLSCKQSTPYNSDQSRHVMPCLPTLQASRLLINIIATYRAIRLVINVPPLQIRRKSGSFSILTRVSTNIRRTSRHSSTAMLHHRRRLLNTISPKRVSKVWPRHNCMSIMP
jgi:hypothetical protein